MAAEQQQQKQFTHPMFALLVESFYPFSPSLRRIRSDKLPTLISPIGTTHPASLVVRWRPTPNHDPHARNHRSSSHRARAVRRRRRLLRVRSHLGVVAMVVVRPTSVGRRHPIANPRWGSRGRCRAARAATARRRGVRMSSSDRRRYVGSVRVIPAAATGGRRVSLPDARNGEL